MIEMVSHSGAFSYKYNTAERGGCSSVFIKVLEFGKVPKRKSSMFKLNSELFSVLNHCNTSSVKNFVNWHSEKV